MMAADLVVVESVGEALAQWTPAGSLIPVASVVSNLSKLLFDDSPDVDSLMEQQEQTNQAISDMTDNVTQNTEAIVQLNENIENLTASIDGFMGFQYFILGTIFSIAFVGFLTTRIMRLFRWGKIRKKEGLM